MEAGVNDHPVQFFSYCGLKCTGIVFYAVNANVNFSQHRIFGLRKKKTNGVGKIVVVKPFFIDGQEIIIIGENNGQTIKPGFLQHEQS